MHSAPSVSYPVVRSRRAALLLLAAWGLGALAILGWAAGSPPSSSSLATALQLASPAWVVLTGVAVAAFWRRLPADALAWDAQHWRCEAAGAPSTEGTLAVALDLQGLVLARFQPARGAIRWLWLDRDAAPGRWHGLRCALAARTRPAPPPLAGDPEAVSR